MSFSSSLGPNLYFQPRQKAKLTATTGNCHRQCRGEIDLCSVIAEDKKSAIFVVVEKANKENVEIYIFV